MSNSSDNQWQDLRLGDRIHFIEWPVELKRANLHEETVKLYDWLIESGEELCVVEIGKDGIPVARLERHADGELKSEYLMVNHGGFRCN